MKGYLPNLLGKKRIDHFYLYYLLSVENLPFRRASDERGESLLQSKQVRPSGSSRDIASLGSGACLGPDISKKVHTMFTVKGDGLTYLQDK